MPWLKTSQQPIVVFSVHAPTGQGTYHKVVNQILDEVSRTANGRDVIIGGDFNLTISPRHPSEKPDLESGYRHPDETPGRVGIDELLEVP